MQRLALERSVVAAQLAVQDEPGQPRAAEQGQRREAQEVGDPVERVHLAVHEEADADRFERQLVVQPKLLGERDHALVGGHDHVIEAIDPVSGEVDRAGQAAQGGGALQQRDLRALLGQAQGENRAEDAGADDAHVWASVGRGLGTGARWLPAHDRPAGAHRFSATACR